MELKALGIGADKLKAERECPAGFTYVKPAVRINPK